MSLNEYIVLDLETTGLSKHRHKITEIAAIKVRNNEVVDEFQTLVNPETHIPSFITKLTGITNEMVEHEPTIDKILPHFKEFMGGAIIVAHNATFDYGFLDHNMQVYMKENLTNPKLCTKKLANRLLPSLPSKKLGLICEHFEIVNKRAHRAMTDVLATQEVLLKFLEILEKNDINDNDKIMKFESLTTSKIRNDNLIKNY